VAISSYGNTRLLRSARNDDGGDSNQEWCRSAQRGASLAMTSAAFFLSLQGMNEVNDVAIPLKIPTKK